MLLPPLKREVQLSLSPAPKDKYDEIELNGSSKNSLPESWHFKSPHSIYESIRASYSKIDEMQSKQINDFSDLETMQSARNIPSLASLNNNIFDLKSAINNKKLKEDNPKLIKSKSTAKCQIMSPKIFDSHYSSIRKNYKDKQYVFVKKINRNKRISRTTKKKPSLAIQNNEDQVKAIIEIGFIDNPELDKVNPFIKKSKNIENSKIEEHNKHLNEDLQEEFEQIRDYQLTNTSLEPNFSSTSNLAEFNKDPLLMTTTDNPSLVDTTLYKPSLDDELTFNMDNHNKAEIKSKNIDQQISNFLGNKVGSVNQSNKPFGSNNFKGISARERGLMFSKKIDFHSIKQIDKHGKRTHRGRIPELQQLR